MPMAIDTLVQDLLASLAAYTSQYGQPETPLQRQAIIASLLNLKTQDTNQSLTAQQVDNIVRLVEADFDLSTLGQAVADEVQRALAQRAHQWQQELQQQVEGVLNTYLQQHNPDLDSSDLEELVTAIAPMVKSGQVTKPEVLGLAQQMAQTFAPDSALVVMANPTVLGLAKDLATVIGQRDTEAAVSETVTAYVEKFAPAAEEIGENLIESALSAILKNQVQFGIDTDLNLAEKRLIIQQVSFKLNIMQQSPPPSKSAELMAQQLNTEIERFKAERERNASTLDVSAGRLSNDGLSISSNWVFTDRPSNSDATQD